MDNEALLDKLWSIAGELKALSENLEANTISKNRAIFRMAKLQEEIMREAYYLNIRLQAAKKLAMLANEPDSIDKHDTWEEHRGEI